MGFSEESISRSPAADLEGGTFFRVSDSFPSRAGTLFFRFPGGRSTLMTASSELCRSVCWLNSGRRVTAADVWPVVIIAAQLTKNRKALLNHTQLLGGQENSYAGPKDSSIHLDINIPWNCNPRQNRPLGRR